MPWCNIAVFTPRKVKTMRSTVLIGALLALAGCASYPMGTVVPKPDGIYEALASSPDKGYAFLVALHTAEVTCANRKMRHVVLGQQAKYNGLFSEQSSNAMAKLAEVAANTTGRYMPTLSTSSDYTVMVAFRCEA